MLSVLSAVCDSTQSKQSASSHSRHVACSMPVLLVTLPGSWCAVKHCHAVQLLCCCVCTSTCSTSSNTPLLWCCATQACTHVRGSAAEMLWGHRYHFCCALVWICIKAVACPLQVCLCAPLFAAASVDYLRSLSLCTRTAPVSTHRHAWLGLFVSAGTCSAGSMPYPHACLHRPGCCASLHCPGSCPASCIGNP